MCRQVNRLRISRRQGLTLVEVLISLALMSVLSLITVQGMIMHGRLAKSNLEMQRMAENARRFVDAVQISALDATSVRIDSGPSGAATVLTIAKPDPGNASAVVTKQYAYIDADSNPATIGDNRLLERDVNTPNATTGKPVLQYCSRDGTTPVFAQLDGAGRPLYEIRLRLGDTTFTASERDNALTGNGYQSFLINASFGTL